MLNVLKDTKTAAMVRTVMQMGGAVLVTYGIMSADDVAQATTNVSTIIGGISAAVSLFGLVKARFAK
jgi:hypothetical protein